MFQNETRRSSLQKRKIARRKEKYENPRVIAWILASHHKPLSCAWVHRNRFAKHSTASCLSTSVAVFEYCFLLTRARRDTCLENALLARGWGEIIFLSLCTFLSRRRRLNVKCCFPTENAIFYGLTIKWQSNLRRRISCVTQLARMDKEKIKSTRDFCAVEGITNMKMKMRMRRRSVSVINLCLWCS